MAIRLTDAEIGHLKQLLAAGDRGRAIGAKFREGLARLIRAHFVSPKSVKSVFFMITAFGRRALSEADSHVPRGVERSGQKTQR
jgi:hypothetical protein